MTRRGSALITVLWLIALLGALSGLALGGARLGHRSTGNRIELLRADWAREGCLQLLRARFADSTWRPRILAGVEQGPWPLSREAGSHAATALGRALSCRVTLEDPGARLNVNLASAEALLRLLGDSGAVAGILAHRPYPAVAALLEWEDIATHVIGPYLAYLTVRGDGRINLNTAHAAVLATLPGMDPAGAARVILARRDNRIEGLDQLMAAVSVLTRERLASDYERLSRTASFAPGELVARVTGTAGDRGLEASETAVLVLTADRMAVVRREVE